MPSMHLEVLAVMMDSLDFRGLIGDMFFAIPCLRIIFPRGIPQPIHDIHVFVCDFIPLVMRHEVFAESIRGRL